MTKILIILGIIFAFFMLMLGLGIRLIKGILKPFTPTKNPRKVSHEENSGDILYRKDDIVVMKGDAGKKRHSN